MLRRVIIGGAAVVIACTVVEGPCKIFADEVYCMQGGKVTIFSPRPIAETVQAANPVPQQINVDPRVLVPPKERN